ncbi:MAG: pentapeptide repeat-containing protein [Paludibacter sp.]
MIEDQIFERINFKEKPFLKAEYENCRFLNCNFHKINLNNCIFRECTFIDCDLSLCNLTDTTLNDVFFNGCKLVGVQFDWCRDFLFSVKFENCDLNLSVLYKRKLKKTHFKNCNLQETDFSDADLSESVFDNCDLQRAVFQKTNLEKVDFRTSFNYSIDPEANKIKKARFSRMGLGGLLDKYGIVIE